MIINGRVIGPVQCDDLLELQPKARIEGDVRYGTIEMHQGAAIDGEIAHDQAERGAAGPETRRRKSKIAASDGDVPKERHA